MKAILVIDMPRDCLACPFLDDICFPKRKFEKGFPFGERPKECPLKPMPSKKVPYFDPNHCDIEKEKQIMCEIDGWNACLEELER